MISVLIPSRGRPKELMNTLKSLHDNIYDHNNIEYLVRLDSDDPELDGYKEIDDKRITKLIAPRGRGYPDMHLFVNELCRIASGDWLFLFNDDAIMNTVAWDKTITDHDWPEICILRPGQSDALNLFPIVSRKFYETLGHFSLNAHNDTWVETIADALDIQFNIPIWINHLRGSILDDTYRESAAAYSTTSPDFYSPETQELLMQDIRKIEEALK